ncbi:hypothetical protein [Paraburkholderia atlantica]|uniref:hypothetical protein n=1 Tax=Paraburkholderia atlantica TaxID=2654982 RepID=UPI0016182656|nr:hypothetical protein [Paraburkholderia atlantica]MBB5420801.1 hypothetical protein [Paraburkholderia atlantica]
MAEEINAKEIFSLVDNASGIFAFAHESFEQIASLFEAIAASLPKHSVAHRLAKLGEDVCDDRASTFENSRDEYNGHVDRYLPRFYGDEGRALVACKSRRISDAEQSSRGNA